MRQQIFNYASLCLALTLLLCGISESQAEQFTLNLSGGSIIVVDADADQVVPWKLIAKNGKVTDSPQSLSDISRIEFTARPASLQTAEVRKLLDQLDSHNYHERKQAQVKLSVQNFGGKFRDLIETEKENPSLEVRTRVKQILHSLGTDANEKERIEYDRLILKNGKILAGDAIDFKLNCEFLGEKLTLDRDSLFRLSSNSLPTASPQSGDFRSVSQHQFNEEDFDQPERFIDFAPPNGEDKFAKNDLRDAFTDRGILMTAKGQGYIGLSGYPLRFPELPTGEQSACVFDPSGAYKKRFIGTSQFSFCVPGLPDAPGGVTKFGLFVSRVDNPRDFILEAFNADSQLIGMTEATDESCCYLGIETNEPIAFARIRSNPFLFEVNRKIDENYAFDSVWFSEPKPLVSIVRERTPGIGVVNLFDGTTFCTEDIRFSGDQVTIFDPQIGRKLDIPFNKIARVRFSDVERGEAFTEPNPESDAWMVMLADRSVVRVEPQGPSGNFWAKALNRPIKKDEMAAIWAERDLFRFPQTDDFADGKDLLVFPTCRVQANIEMDEQGMSWSDAKELLQPVYPRLLREKRDESEKEDVTPKYNAFKFAKRTESQMPTVWFKPPQLINPDHGKLRLRDGQLIVLGSNNGISIESINNQEVVLKSATGDPFKIRNSSIQAIQFPAN